MGKPKLSVPNKFKKIKSDKPKTRRNDRVEEEEKIIVQWFKKEPHSTILFHTIIAFGISICFIAFDYDSRIIAKFFAAMFSSYMLFEEFPCLYRRFTK